MDSSSPPASPLSTQGDDVIMEGYLLKQASRLSQKYYHNRYFTFRADNTLSYSRRKDDGECRGGIHVSHMNGCEVSDLFVEKHQKKLVYCLRITSSDDVHTGDYDDRSGTDEDESIFSGRNDEISINASGSPQRQFQYRNNHNKLAASAAAEVEKAPKIPRSPFAKLRKKTLSPESSNVSSNGRGGTAHSVDGVAVVGGNSSTSVSSILRLRRKNGRKVVVGESNSNDAGGDAQSVVSVPNLVELDQQQFLPARPTSSFPTLEIGTTTVDDDVISSDVTPRHSNNHQQQHHRPPPTDFEAEQIQEQEYLRSKYLSSRKEHKRKNKRRLVQGTKLAAVAGATVGITIVTAGVGLVAGLVALGVAGAAGGGGAAMDWFSWQEKNRNKRSCEIVIACSDYETARQWKSCLDAALQSDTVQKSTWGQIFASDKQKARAAVLPNKRRPVLGRELSHSSFGVSGGANVFFRTNAKWTLLEGGLLSVVGCGYQGLRILREERFDQETSTNERGQRIVSHLSVDGKPCVPMKSHVVLSTSPLNAFLCLMSYGRIESIDEYGVPDVGEHRISFEVIESIDEHTDVIHLVMRPLYLFPSWTTSRDFVLYRYWRLEQDGSYIVCYESFEHAKCPPSPDHVRGEMHQVFNIAPLKKNLRRRAAKQNLPSNECLMTATVQVDPKGWVPTSPFPIIFNQAYGDAFGIAALCQLADIRDAVDHDRFVPVVDITDPYQQGSITVDDIQQYSGAEDSSPSSIDRNLSTDSGEDTLNEDFVNYDFTYASRESRRFVAHQKLTELASNPPPLTLSMWAEPDPNSFRVRGAAYLSDRKKQNAGPSIGRLITVDLVHVDKPIFSGFCLHPTERVQLGLKKEAALKAKGLKSNMPPFIFVMNICVPGPPYYHGVYYFAIDDMCTIDGSNGSPSSKLCNKFFFGNSDEFRDKTFKLIPQIVEGNFVVRKAVGSTPAIMGKKLRQLYVRSDRFCEIVLDCGSSSVATGVMRLSLGYAKSLVVDMGFLFEGDDEEHLPERILGCVRTKNFDFGPQLRQVIAPPS